MSAKVSRPESEDTRTTWLNDELVVASIVPFQVLSPLTFCKIGVVEPPVVKVNASAAKLVGLAV